MQARGTIYHHSQMVFHNGFIDNIVKCLLEAQKDDLPPIHKELLCSPLQDSLLKLQEKFKSR